MPGIYSRIIYSTYVASLTSAWRRSSQPGPPHRSTGTPGRSIRPRGQSSTTSGRERAPAEGQGLGESYRPDHYMHPDVVVGAAVVVAAVVACDPFVAASPPGTSPVVAWSW